MKKALPTIIRNSIDKSITVSIVNPKFSLIWLHGLGDSAEGFYEYFLHPLSPLYKDFRIKLIQAPERDMTLHRTRMNSWYDIKQENRFQEQSKVYDLKHLKESMNIVNQQVEQQVEHWKSNPSQIHPYHRIMIGGFSQGCAVALKFGLQTKKPLAGIIGFSGFLFPSTQLTNLGRANILINHGRLDPVIPIDYSFSTYQKISADPQVKVVPIHGLPHSVSLQQLKHMTQWMTTITQQFTRFYKPKN